MDFSSNSQRTQSASFDYHQQLERLKAITEEREKLQNGALQQNRGQVQDLKAQELSLRERLEREKAEKEAKAKIDASQQAPSTDTQLKAIENYTMPDAAIPAPPPPPAANASTPLNLTTSHPLVQQYQQSMSHQQPMNSAANFPGPGSQFPQFPQPFGMQEYNPQAQTHLPLFPFQAQYHNPMVPPAAVSSQASLNENMATQMSPKQHLNSANQNPQNSPPAFQIPGLRTAPNASLNPLESRNASIMNNTKTKSVLNETATQLPGS